MEIFQTFASPRNAAAYYEMTRAVNADGVLYETENQIYGQTTIEDYAAKMLR